MGVKNYQSYVVTKHARSRIMNRFNITEIDMKEWVSRLLAHAEFQESDSDSRSKYRYKDVVVILDESRKSVITAYSQNHYDDFQVDYHTNPEVKSVINKALGDYITHKKIKIAVKINDYLEKAYESNSKMIKPYTNYRFATKSWENMIKNFKAAQDELEKGMGLIEEAENKIAEK